MKWEENVRKVVHPEWFTVAPYQYNEKIDTEYNIPYGQGLIISPKYPKLKGKITIPAEMEYNGTILPIIAIKDFGGSYTLNTNSTQEITHVFMEEGKENKLYHIVESAFCKSNTLTYFDFDNCNVRIIGTTAFYMVPNLSNNSFGNKLLEVHMMAFNQSLNSKNKTIMLPASLIRIRDAGFGYLGCENCSLQIGTENNLSMLKFQDGDEANYLLAQNDELKFKNINFYSYYYNVGDNLALSILNQAWDSQGNGSISIV